MSQGFHAAATKVTITTAPQRIAADAAQQVFLSCPTANSGSAFIGGSTVDTTSGYPIAKGTSFGPIAISDAAGVWVIGTANDVLNVLVVN